MPKWLDTRGNKPISIAICARCGMKYPYTELSEDPNYPGLFCHGNIDDGCLDVLDPWRLPARETENISINEPRPDYELRPGQYNASLPIEQAVIGDTSPGFSMIGTQGGQPFAVAPPMTTLQQPAAWQPYATYIVGSQVTPGNPVGMNAAGQDILVYECLVPGKAAATAPEWPTEVGQMVWDNNAVLWACAGRYMP